MIVYLRQRRRYMRLPAMFVCLSVCLSVGEVTEKRVHEFGWNFACRQVSGRRNRKIWKSKICRSQSNKHLTHSRLQVTSCTAERYCLLHVVVQGPRSFQTFLYGVRLRSYGASNLPNFRTLAFVGGTCAPSSALLVWFVMFCWEMYCVNILMFRL